jgi:hypothetical protein
VRRGGAYAVRSLLLLLLLLHSMLYTTDDFYYEYRDLKKLIFVIEFY